MKINLILVSLLLLLSTACSQANPPINDSTMDEIPPTNSDSPEKMLLVLSAPSIHDDYYAPAFDKIVAFQIAYAREIIGRDNVVVIVDQDTYPSYQGKLPSDVLLVADVYDIWMRDFTTVNPDTPVQFTYTWASMTKRESEQVQRSFTALADEFGITREKTNLLLDGGNMVDNYNGNFVTTTRFMEDNGLDFEEAKETLRDLLHAKNVAILEPDEEVLAHSDGMVSWIDTDVLAVNDYSFDPEFRALVLDELNATFPNTKIVEVPVEYKTNAPGEWEGFESACGVNLNAVLTFKYLYVPTFNMTHDQQALETIRQNTTKNVIPIDAQGVCGMGGSVRCLTWQVTGENAQKLILAARQR